MSNECCFWKNYKRFRIAFLHNKFGSSKSIVVPDTEVNVNDFIDLKDLIKDHDTYSRFNIHGNKPGILGEVLLPGEGNYCIIDKEYFHLEKTNSQGKMMNGNLEEEGFFYTVIYDDGMNDGLQDNVVLQGTIDKTGDRELVKKHIVQTMPLVTNVNDYKLLDGIKKTGHNRTRFKQASLKNFLIPVSYLTNNDYWALKAELEKMNLGEPNEDKLVIPLLYIASESGDGRWNILRSIESFVRRGFYVYDLGDYAPRQHMEAVLGQEEVYSIASRDNITFKYSKSINPTKYVESVDLSGCTDLVELDPVTFLPKYSKVEGAENTEPVFSIDAFLTSIINKFGFTSSDGINNYREEFRNILIEEITKELSGIVSYKDYETEELAHIFKNVEVERIDRKLQGITNEINSDAYEIFDGFFPFFKFQKNFVGHGTANTVRYLALVKENTFNDENAKQIIEIAKEKYQSINTIKGLGDFKNDYKIERVSPDDNTTLKTYEISKYFEYNSSAISYVENVFILDSSRYKLKCKDCDDLLDFSRSGKYNAKIVALIPDYNRKTHVLAVSKFIPTNIKYSDDDPQVQNRGPIQLLTLNEISKIENDTIDDFKNPPRSFMSDYGYDTDKHGGNIAGTFVYEDEIRYSTSDQRDTNSWYSSDSEAIREASEFGYRPRRLLGHAIALRELMCYGRHVILYKYMGSHCYKNNYCEFYDFSINQSKLESRNNQVGSTTYTLYHDSYDENKDWREFPTRITLPYKIDTLDAENTVEGLKTIAKDVDKKYFRGEVLNSSNKKSATIRKYAFYINPNNLQIEHLNKQTEANIPPDTVIAVGMVDRDIVYKEEGSGKNYDLIYDISLKIYKLFISDWGEGNGGAIPSGIKNDSAGQNGKRDKNGKPVLRFNGIKSYKGRYYIASVMFVPPQFYPLLGVNKFLRYNTGSRVFDFGYSNDGFVSIVPDPYHRTQTFTSYSRRTVSQRTSANNVIPEFSYRQPITNVTERAILAFLFNGCLVNNCLGRFSNRRGSMDMYSIFGGNGGHANIGHYLFYNIVRENQEKPILGKSYKEKVTLKSNRTSNPRTLRTRYTFEGKELRLAEIDNEIPSFMVKYFDIKNHVLCKVFHDGERPKDKNNKDFLAIFGGLLRERIQNHCKQIKSFLNLENTLFELKGTDGYVSVKLNTISKDRPYGDFELFTKSKDAIKNTEDEKWNFKNEIIDDIDVMINSTNELNIHGKKIPLKTRFTKTDELDIGLTVTSIHDPTQSRSSSYYKVSLKNDDMQDVILTTLEVPKKLVKSTDISVFQQESLNRQIIMNSQEREADVKLHELDKQEFKMGDKFSRRNTDIEYRKNFDMGLLDTMTAFRHVSPGGDLSAIPSSVGNVMYSMGRGIINARAASQTGWSKTDEINERYKIGTSRLDTKGQLLAAKNKDKQQKEFEEILSYSNKVNYPQTNNQLIYRSFNQLNQVEDIHILHTFPSGKLLEYIKNYYKEHGYEVLVRDFICNGISSIKRHLRYVTIERSEHKNEGKKLMIEERALNGIKIISGTNSV